MSIRGTFMCAAGAFLVTAVLFAAAMVIAQRVFTAGPVDHVVPNTGENAVEADGSEPVTDDIALTTDRDVSTPQALDDSTAVETTTQPPDEPASVPDELEDDAPPADAPSGDGEGDRNNRKPASSKDDAKNKRPDTAQAPPDANSGSQSNDANPSSPKNDADAGSEKKPEPSQPQQPVQTPAPSAPEPTKPQTQTSSLVTEPSSTEQRDDIDDRGSDRDRRSDRDHRSDRDREGWDFFRRRDYDRSWSDFFHRRSDYRGWRYR